VLEGITEVHQVGKTAALKGEKEKKQFIDHIRQFFQLPFILQNRIIRQVELF